MQVIREDLNPCTVRLSVTCDPDEVRAGYDRAVRRLAKSVRLPGFRAGQAPRAMIERALDPSKLFAAASEEIVSRTLSEAVKAENLEPDPNTRPNVDLKKLMQNEGTCEYDAKIPLPPVVELADYAGLQLRRMPSEVTEAEVDYQIDELRKRRSTREAITDRGVGEGDVAVLNIKAEGEPGEGRNFMTVAGQTFAELDAGIYGMKQEEVKHLELTFPKSFHEKDWAGKTLKCEVTLTSASSVKLPEVDQSFAQSLQTEGVDDLRARLREQLGSAKAEMIREMLIEQAMEELLSRSKIEVSDNAWETIAQRRLAETAQEQAAAGKSMEAYAEESGMTLDELQAAWREKAKLYIKRAFIIREIFTKEKMALTSRELNLELALLAREYETSPDEMLVMLRKNDALEELRFRALSRKVSDFLIAKAVVSEAEPGPAGKPAPKAAQKPAPKKPAKGAKPAEA